MLVHRSRVPLLILAHLGLAPLACKEDVAPPVSLPIASATATPPAAPSTKPSASVVATATATPTTTATPPDGPAVCKSDADCGPGFQCANATPSGGTCTPRQHYFLGRPLVVDGESHTAPYASAPAERTERLARWLSAAQEEHASVAAFARTVSELMALGAPGWLLTRTCEALGDELRHTELTLDVLERETGTRPALGPLEAAVAPLRSGPDAPRALFRDVFRGGVIGETLSAAHAESERGRATDPLLIALYDTLLADESRHAALALQTARWLVTAYPELKTTRDEEIERLRATGSFEARALVLPLLDAIA